jgi:hypothetical protein
MCRKHPPTDASITKKANVTIQLTGAQSVVLLGKQ